MQYQHQPLFLYWELSAGLGSNTLLFLSCFYVYLSYCANLSDMLCCKLIGELLTCWLQSPSVHTQCADVGCVGFVALAKLTSGSSKVSKVQGVTAVSVSVLYFQRQMRLEEVNTFTWSECKVLNWTLACLYHFCGNPSSSRWDISVKRKKCYPHGDTRGNITRIHFIQF